MPPPSHPRSRRGRAPHLLMRPRAKPRTPSCSVEAVAGGTGLCWPCEERCALGLRLREQRRDGAQPHGQTVTHRALSPLGPARCLPRRILRSPARLPPPIGDPRSALVPPPGAARPLRPAEWPGLLAAGAAQGRLEAGSARISINLGPRRELRQAPSPSPAPGPRSELTPEGPPCKHEGFGFFF